MTEPARCVRRRVRSRANDGSWGSAMPVRRLDEDGLAAVQAALGDASVLARCRAKIVTVPGSECLWWAHAVSGRGHGRFWLARGRVVIAHRFGFAVMHGVDALADAALLGHRWDNPLCQRIAPGHVEVSSALRNRRDWSIRRNLPDSPLADPRGPWRRARELRDMAATDPELVEADMEHLRQRLG